MTEVVISGPVWAWIVGWTAAMYLAYSVGRARSEYEIRKILSRSDTPNG